MAARKPATTRKPAAKRGPPSLLTRVGDAAATAAKRSLLIETLLRHDWYLTAVAEALGLASHADVIRAIHALGLTDAYELARAAGRVSQGTRAK